MSRSRTSGAAQVPRRWAGLVTWVALGAGAAYASDLSGGTRALEEGRVGEAITLLRGALAQQSRPATHLLLCRAFYAEGHYDEAAPECAASLAAPTSEAYLWAGRVTGERARHKNPLLAFSLARETRDDFEQAVRMDPANLDAVADLGEYYVHAPGIVGGGVERARQLAATVQPRSAQMAHLLLATVAGKTGDAAGAEREYRAGIAAATPAELPAAWVDLARFLRRARQTEAAVEAARTAIATDRRHDGSLVSAARLLGRMHREPEAAIAAVQLYLVSPARSDEAPAFKVRLLLASLLASTGDREGAARERGLAHAMAPDYVVPASDAGAEQVP